MYFLFLALCKQVTTSDYKYLYTIITNIIVIHLPAHMPFFAPSLRGDFIFWVTRTRNAKPSAARDPCPHQAPARTKGKD
jgi:hypothetical protein